MFFGITPQIIQTFAEGVGQCQKAVFVKADELASSSSRQFQQALHVDYLAIVQLQLAAEAEPVTLLLDFDAEPIQAGLAHQFEFFTLGPFHHGFVTDFMEFQQDFQAAFGIIGKPLPCLGFLRLVP